MDIALSWNLVLVAAFVVLFAYNFLLGQNSTVKLILSIYIATLTADGVASIIKQFVFDISPGFQSLTEGREEGVFASIRIALFISAIVIFVVKGGFHIHLEKHKHWAVRTAIHAGFSGISAALFLATILIYLSGNSFVEGMRNASEIVIYHDSIFARILIDYYQFWFSIPAVAFLVTSFFFHQTE
jgi:hypothetical protein